MRNSNLLTTDVPTTARLLGWSGLIPFCALPLAMLWLPEHAATAGEVLGYYAFGILCFLLGIWWGIGVMRGEPGVLLYSNGLFLVLFTARALLGLSGFMLVAALLFIAVLLLERILPVFQRQPRYYAIMRSQLSLVAAASLLISGQVLS